MSQGTLQHHDLDNVSGAHTLEINDVSLLFVCFNNTMICS